MSVRISSWARVPGALQTDVNGRVHKCKYSHGTHSEIREDNDPL
jgi:hypothetical protein